MKKETYKKLLSTSKSVGRHTLRALYLITCHIVLIVMGFMIGAAVMSKKCEARVLYYGSETETVTVAYGGATIFRFNEAVKTISRASQFSITPSDQDNPDYAVLSVKPLFTKGKNKVTFLLANGAVVTTKIVVVLKANPETTDSFYDFLPKDTLIEKRNTEGSNITDLDLMKAMHRWENVMGYKVRSIARTVDTGVINLSAKLVRIYTGSKYNGYVFKIRNHSKKKSYKVDIKNLTLGKPNQALLSQIDNQIIRPKGLGKNVTFLRIVARPTSVYYNVNLPMGLIQKN